MAGNQLSLVNETNVDSIIFIYINFIYRVCSTQLLADVVSLSWFQSHFFNVQNYVAVRSQIW